MVEFDESLISAVKDYPCLYNIRISDFKVTWKKENAWKEISRHLNTPGMNVWLVIMFINYFIVDVITKRWKVLHERYTKEHKKMPTGTGANEASKDWEFYHMMDYLKDFVKHRR